MLGEAESKDIFFAKPIKTPSQQNTVKCKKTHGEEQGSSHSRRIKTIQ